MTHREARNGRGWKIASRRTTRRRGRAAGRCVHSLHVEPERGMTEVLCPKCGTPYLPGAVYCSKCGSQGPTQLSVERAVARQEEPVARRLASALGKTYVVKGLLGSGG